ncbi:MAG: hypothetical protein SGARI_006729, partial [Bacillariaceae sp.]
GGIGVDHWAALIVSGDTYKVLSLEGKPGSVLQSDEDDSEDATFAVDDDGTAKGVPGIWIKQVDESGVSVAQKVCPQQGRIQDLLRAPSRIVQDSKAIQQCRNANPSG